MTQQNTQTGTGQSSVDDLHYSYNDVGNVTSEADTPPDPPARPTPSASSTTTSAG